MKFIIYHSKSKDQIQKDTTELIAENSHNNNSTKGITGMLLAWEDNYIQYLEGADLKTLNDLMDIIKRDPRHEVKMTFKGETESRIFNEWSMGAWYMGPEEIDSKGGVTDLLKTLYSTDKNHLPTTEYFLRFMSTLLLKWQPLYKPKNDFNS